MIRTILIGLLGLITLFWLCFVIFGVQGSTALAFLGGAVGLLLIKRW